MNLDYDPSEGYEHDDDDTYVSYEPEEEEYDEDDEQEDYDDPSRRPFFDEEQDDGYQPEDDIGEFFRQDPLRALDLIGEQAAQRAEARMQSHYGPVVEKMARGVVESSVLGRVPEGAKDSARKIISGLDPMQLAHLNEDGLSALANMAIGQAFWEGRLQSPRSPQTGEPVGGRGMIVRLTGGVTPDDLDGYQRMTGKRVDSRWLKSNGYSR